MTAPTEDATAAAVAPAAVPDGAPGQDAVGAKPAAEAGRLDAYLPSRREALFLLGGGAFGAVVGGGTLWYRGRAPVVPERDDRLELTSRDAKDRLELGNARFVAGTPLRPDQSVQRRGLVAKGQHPFAAVLSCADSRVPPEVLFDQGLGDLFVVRSAGQVVDHAVMGSLQYGVEHLGTPLLVVLGHSQCGAVKATVEAFKAEHQAAEAGADGTGHGTGGTGTDIDALVAAIRPAVAEAEEVGAKESELVDVSIGINVERIVEQLKSAPVINEASLKREVKVVGATYDLATGHVEWL